MKKRIDIVLKCSTPEQAATTLEEIAVQIRACGFAKAPSDLREFEDIAGLHGFQYDVSDNDGTDMYGNALEAEPDAGADDE